VAEALRQTGSSPSGSGSKAVATVALDNLDPAHDLLPGLAALPRSRRRLEWLLVGCKGRIDGVPAWRSKTVPFS